MRGLVGVLILVALVASVAHAAPVTVAVWGDSDLRGGTTGYANNYNYGGSQPLYASTNVGATSSTYEMIVGFDLASAGITGGTVNNATLQLYQSTSGGAATYSVYEGTGVGSQNWIEGTSTGAVSTTAVTYSKYDGVNSWTTAGGDYSTGNVATGTSTGNNQYVTIDVTAQVQDMINAGDTRATFYIFSNKTGSSLYIASKENGNTAFHEQLSVDVTPTPEPATMCLLVMGGLGLLARRRRSA